MKIVCISCYQQYNIKSSSKFKFKIFFLSHDQIMDTKLCVNAIDLDSFIKVKPISPWFHFDIHKWVKHSRLTIILVEKCTPLKFVDMNPNGRNHTILDFIQKWRREIIVDCVQKSQFAQRPWKAIYSKRLAPLHNLSLCCHYLVKFRIPLHKWSRNHLQIEDHMSVRSQSWIMLKYI